MLIQNHNDRLYLDDPAGRYVNGREVVSNPGEDSRFGLIKRWLHYCDINHNNCQEREPPFLPTRVLDVGSQHPVLLVSEGRRGHYVALSYCWGGPQTIMTTHETFERFTTEVDDGVSQTLKDAIEITRVLNLRYLWIDALCIIQGGEDFNIESLKMSQYYGNAYFTLSAGCAARSQDGFLTSRPPAPAAPCKLDYYRPASGVPATSPHGSVFVCLPPSHSVGPLVTRAWTYQESVLTRRELLYGQEQISFRCLERRISENGTSVILEQQVPYLSVRGLDLKPLAEQKTEMLCRWYSMLEHYTRRDLTDPADKLTALAGIAQVIHNILQCNYLFGLWEDDMIRGLLWTTNTDRYSKDWAESLRRPGKDRAPSWSWASVEGHVSHTHTKRSNTKFQDPKNHRVTILDHNVQRHSFDPIRSMRPISYELKVRGVLKRVQRGARHFSQYQPEGPRYRFRHPKLILLEALQTAPLTEMGPNNPPVVIGLGFFDVPDESFPDLTCMELINGDGLILVSNKKGAYRRVGTFYVEDQSWFDHGELEDITLT